MKTTPNIGLRKPDQEDFYNVDDFNYNADVIDQEIVKRIINSGGVPSIQAGLDASKPAPGTAGRIYVATDTQIIYLDTGSAWKKIGTGVVNWGDIVGKPGSFPPAAHKSTHASGGSDPLTPADIGAIPTSAIGAPGGVAELDGAGLIPVSRIPSSFARVDQANTFAGQQTFSGLIVPNGGFAGALGTNGINGNPIGWNLLPNSSFRLGSAFWNDGSGGLLIPLQGNFGEGGYLTNGQNFSNVTATYESIKIPMRDGISLTLSADVVTGGISSGSISVELHAWNGSTDLGVIGAINPPNTSGWRRYAVSATTPANTTAVTVKVKVNGVTAVSASFGIKRIKLEFGNIATPYTAEADLWPMLTHGVGGGPVIAVGQVNGIKMQYGTGNITSFSATGGTQSSYQATYYGSLNISFPYAFNNSPKVFVTANGAGSSGTYGLLWLQVPTITPTGFIVTAWTTGGFSNVQISWLAIEN